MTPEHHLILELIENIEESSLPLDCESIVSWMTSQLHVYLEGQSKQYYEDGGVEVM